MSNSTPVIPPTALRRLDTASAAELSRLVAAFEELQTVLRCCERLIDEFGRAEDEPDDLAVEAAWTLALLSYGRTFGLDGAQPVLTEADLVSTQPDGDVLSWHRLLIGLRARHAHPAANPRELFSVGVAQDADGAASAIAITSARQPSVDAITVRQTGALAYGLCRLLDERIAAQQATVFDEVRRYTPAQVGRLTELDLAPATG